jgi:putative NADH-flavin reductase
MQLTILGASGRTGQHLVTQALGAGHSVTAVVRNANAVTAQHSELRVAVRRSLTAEDLRSTFEGADAVLSALGTSKPRLPTTVYSQAAAACLEAMTATAVSRIVALSAIPVGPELLKSPSERIIVHRLLHAFFGGGYDDMARMEHTLASSGLAWTVLRPPRLTDRPAKRHYRSMIDARLSHASSIPRRDLATAMIDALNHPTWIGHAINIAT